MNPVQHITSYFFKIHFNITLVSLSRSFKQYIFFSVFPAKTWYMFLICTMCSTYPSMSHPVFGKVYTSWSSSLLHFCLFFCYCPLVAPVFSPTPCSQIPSICVFLLTWETKIHTHILGKVTVLYIVSVMFWDGKNGRTWWNGSRSKGSVIWNWLSFVLRSACSSVWRITSTSV